MTNLLIVQPRLTTYRLPFFEGLIAELAKDDIACRVASPPAGGVAAARGDSDHNPPWHTFTQGGTLRIRGRTISYLGSGPAQRSADAVIVAMLGSSYDTYRAILTGKFRGIPVGLWGHIKSYTSESHPLDALVERWQLMNASRVFAYTPGGAAEAIRLGVRPHAVTTVMNSVDTATLCTAASAVDPAVVDAFVERHSLDRCRTAAYFGGLDQAKRIDFLAESLAELAQLDPRFKLIVGGRGASIELLRPAIDRGQVIHMGYVGSSEKALVSKVASTLAMPGRIGLIAVEALALGLPVITTKWKYHSAEIEYLQEGVSMFSSDDDPRSYAHKLLASTERFAERPAPARAHPTMDQMIGNFAAGVRAMLV
ncbi:glycosyltransferase [Nakamurella leprariae]|uniref:Glycosyltransferase n=1 Tax=Nakamurella leprariae TaxID=2803911 RepID=A0A938YAU5_9ACTN|nr:glycosyltransferase [Nakamurella leprariae]MBM9469126.1 glycosyltransferase [Nakamurella leprariae]